MTEPPETSSPPPSALSSSTSPAGLTAADLPIASPVAVPSSILVRFGGVLGVAGTVFALGLLLAGCAGMNKALLLSWVPLGAGALGLVIVLLGALVQRRRLGEDTHVLQGLFACMMSIVGGLLELAIWMKWPIFK